MGFSYLGPRYQSILRAPCYGLYRNILSGKTNDHLSETILKGYCAASKLTIQTHRTQLQTSLFSGAWWLLSAAFHGHLQRSYPSGSAEAAKGFLGSLPTSLGRSLLKGTGRSFARATRTFWELFRSQVASTASPFPLPDFCPALNPDDPASSDWDLTLPVEHWQSTSSLRLREEGDYG